MEYLTLTAGELAETLMTRGVSLPKQAKLWGVSPLQLRNYRRGFSESPRIDVAYNVLRNIQLDGKPVVIAPYKSPEAIIEAYGMYTNDSLSTSN